MRILITNDDGIHAPGLAVLERIARRLSDDIYVVAPETDQSGVSHSLSLSDPLRLREISPRHFAVQGTPTDCVLMGVHHILRDHKPNLVLSGDGFGFSGSAALDASHALISADVTHLSLHPGDDISLKLARGRSGYALTARGAAFDVRGLLTTIRDKNDQAGGFPDLALDARVDRLVGFNQETVNGAALTLVSVGGETQKLSFSGTLDGKPLTLGYGVAPNGTKLSGRAGDAGAVLRFVNFYTHVSGGAMTLDGEGDRNQPLLGTMRIDNFDITDEAAMRRVIGEDSAQARNDPDFNPNRVHFSRMLAHWRRTDHVLAIEDALLAGPAIGATFSGRYDVAAANVDIAGTYLPAYALNNLFSRIPIVGLALGGDASEGLFGVTFKVQGPIDQPEVLAGLLRAFVI